MILMASALGINACALPAHATALFDGSAVVRSVSDQEALERSQVAIRAVGDGTIECRLSGDSTVLYVGPTDDSLLHCLAEHRSPGLTLLISSGGGDAVKAIEAANSIAERGWAIRVRGICASSCGNWLIPAASSVTVEPFSAILLHGGPVNSDAYVEAVQDQVEARQRAEYPEVSNEAILEGRRIMRSVMLHLLDAHGAFVEAQDVRPEWYLLDEFAGPDGGFSPSDFAVIDPNYLERQAPRVEQGDYWFPYSPEDRTKLEAMITGAALFYRSPWQ